MSGFDLSNFLASFFDEARERLNAINQALVKFEAGDLNDEGMVALRRDAHTIKGSALMLGVTDIGETAHLFEDMMEQLLEHPSWRTVPAMTQFLYDIHDALDDRLRDTDSEQLIDVAPLKANKEHLLEHIDEELQASESSTTISEEAPEAVDVSAHIDTTSTEPIDSTAASSFTSQSYQEDTSTFVDVEKIAQTEPQTDAHEQHISSTDNTATPAFDGDDDNSIDINFDDDLPNLDDWLDSDSLDLDISALNLDDILTDSTALPIVDKPDDTVEPASKTISNELPDAQGADLIGAGEAEAWKQQRKKEREEQAEQAEKHLDIQSDDAPHPAANEGIAKQELTSPESKLETPPSATPIQDTPSDTTSNSTTSSFRPDIEQMEMKKTAQRQSSGRFLRVDAERLENLSNQVIELSTQQARDEAFETQFKSLSRAFQTLQRDFQHFTQSLDEWDETNKRNLIHQLNIGFDQQLRQQRRFIEEVRFSNVRNEYMMRDLRDQVLSLMLRPLDNIFSTFPRSIRDVAIRLNKRVRLVIGGKTLEMDQGVTEALVEPLIHLLNNAVAHGIEPPEERRAAGKPEEGQVSIIAQQNGSEISIEIIDDGRGLDTELIKEAAVSKGVTTQVEADQMDSAEILEMIFRPGFTTKKTVDDTSGRGIGMNVVQDTVRRLTGSIRIKSEVGSGTRFILSIPVSIAVQFALIFRMGEMRFGMLTHMVEQAIPYRPEDIQRGSDGKEFIQYEHYNVPLVDMRHVLGNIEEDSIDKKGNIIIAEHIEGYVGIVVDELLNDIEIVVRDLDPYIKRYNPQGLMGNTITADGSVIMLLEPYGIKEMGRTSPDQHIEVHVEDDEKLCFNILLVDDSLIAREVEKSIFESIGFNVDTAIDGLDALEKLQANDYDMVVTDLEMPRLDGFGLVRRIRNQSRYEDLPLMIISTRESSEDRMRALESGADTYMVKQQLNGDEILQTVKALVGNTTKK